MSIYLTMSILGMPVTLAVAWLVVIPIVIAVLAMGVAAGTLANTKNNEIETNSAAYDRLLSQMRLQCRSGAFQVNTNECSVWVAPQIGENLKIFYFYSSLELCDPKKTTFITFLDDGETIRISRGDGSSKDYQARFLAAEVDKLLIAKDVSCKIPQVR